MKYLKRIVKHSLIMSKQVLFTVAHYMESVRVLELITTAKRPAIEW